MAIISSVSILPLILLKFSYFALFYFIYIYICMYFFWSAALETKHLLNEATAYLQN